MAYRFTYDVPNPVICAYAWIWNISRDLSSHKNNLKVLQMIYSRLLFSLVLYVLRVYARRKTTKVRMMGMGHDKDSRH